MLAAYKELGSRRVAAAPKSSVILPIANLIAFVVVVIVNAAGSAGAIGTPVQVVSDKLPTLITPAGWTFAIWGFIYTAMALFCVYALLPSQRGSPVISRLSFVFIANCLCNSIWIIMWCTEVGNMWPSVVFMFLILGTNIVMYFLLDVNYGPRKWKTVIKWPDGEQTTWSAVQIGIYQVWLSIYLAWISVATVANVAGAAVGVGAQLAWNPEGWSVLFQCVVCTLAVTNMLWRKDFVFGLAAAWALLGIATAYNPGEVAPPQGIYNITTILNITIAPVTVEARTQVSTSAFVLSAILVIVAVQVIVRLIIRKRKSSKQDKNSGSLYNQ